MTDVIYNVVIYTCNSCVYLSLSLINNHKKTLFTVCQYTQDNKDMDEDMNENVILFTCSIAIKLLLCYTALHNK